MGDFNAKVGTEEPQNSKCMYVCILDYLYDDDDVSIVDYEYAYLLLMCITLRI